VCKHTLRTTIRWDADDIDGQRMLAEVRPKEADLQALKATAESLMLDLLQKILEIEENMEVCAANSHTNKELKCPNTRTRFHWSSYQSHKRIASAWIPTEDTHNQKKPYHVQLHPPHEPHPPSDTYAYRLLWTTAKNAGRASAYSCHGDMQRTSATISMLDGWECCSRV